MGDFKNNTTMHNIRVRTKTPPKLVDVTNAPGVCQYDPAVLHVILHTILGVNDQITYEFEDGSTIVIWGALKSFLPQQLVENQTPLADFEVVPTNYDDVNHVEALPVITEVAGT